MRAVFDLLGAGLATSWHYSDERTVRAWLIERAGGVVPVADGLASVLDHGEILADIRTEQQRWLAGEPGVRAFAPLMSATSRLSPSKLTKAQKSLIEATDISWPPRTGADEYIRILTREALMEATVETTTRAWVRSRVIAVGGGKGGVGKSTVAAALARNIARSGQEVTLLDLDLESPSQHLIFGLDENLPLDSAGVRMAGTEVAPGLRVLSNGQIEALPRIWNGGETRQWLTFLSRHVQLADVVVLDMPPGHGGAGDLVYPRHSEFAADVRLVVTTADPLALDATKSSVSTRDHHGQIPRVVVENASVVSDGEHTIRLHGARGDVEIFAAGNALEYAGSLPWAPGGDIGALADCEAMTALRQRLAMCEAE